MSDTAKSRYAGRWYDEANSGHFLAYVNACIFGQIRGEGNDRLPAVRADPIAAEQAACPEDPRDGLALSEDLREGLK